MFEYITETGVFGLFWVILTILFPFITYKFIKRNPKKTIQTILPVVIILFLFNVLAGDLIGKTRFDLALTLVRDMWFLCYHVCLMSAYLLVDKELLNSLFENKRG